MCSRDPNTGKIRYSNGKKGTVVEWFVFCRAENISKSNHIEQFLGFWMLKPDLLAL